MLRRRLLHSAIADARAYLVASPRLVQYAKVHNTLKTYATSSTTTRKPRAKPSSSKKTPKKPKATKSKAKKAKKTKKAAKPKKPVRPKKPKKQPTKLEIQRAKIRKLRELALLDTPKPLPDQPFHQYIHQQTRKDSGSSTSLADAARKYRSLSESEKASFARTAAQNKEQNQATLQKWIESHTPAEIYAANNARRSLNRISKLPTPEGAKRSLVGRRIALLKDARLSPRSATAFSTFVRDRWASGDFSDVPLSEASRSIAAEWKALGVSEKEKYTDVAKQAHAEYTAELNRVLGISAS